MRVRTVIWSNCQCAGTIRAANPARQAAGVGGAAVGRDVCDALASHAAAQGRPRVDRSTKESNLVSTSSDAVAAAPAADSVSWLHGVPGVTKDHEGYVYWRGRHVEHFSYSHEEPQREAQAAHAHSVDGELPVIAFALGICEGGHGGNAGETKIPLPRVQQWDQDENSTRDRIRAGG